MANRGSSKLNDGSLSDTQTYSDVKPDFNSYALWLKHNSSAANRLSEGDSLEKIMSSPGLARNPKLLQQQPTSQQNAKINRSSSIRLIFFLNFVNEFIYFLVRVFPCLFYFYSASMCVCVCVLIKNLIYFLNLKSLAIFKIGHIQGT